MMSFKEGHKVGASKSILKTVSEIENFVQSGREKLPEEKLREFLHAHLAELSYKWMRRGFRRGCIELEREVLEKGKLPKRITYNGERELFPGLKRDVQLSWKSKKGSGFKLKLNGKKEK